MASPLSSPTSGAQSLAQQFPHVARWFGSTLGQPIDKVVRETVGEAVADATPTALEWLENVFRNAPVLGPTTHMGAPASDAQPATARAGDTDAGKSVTQRVSQQDREARLASIIAQARNPQRADRDADLLSASLSRPLVYTEQNGQRVPFATTQAAPGWRSGADARTVVGYSEDDVLEPATWGSPEKVGRLQHRLVNAGLLTGDFKFGYYDDATAAAYRELLTFASTQGMTSVDAMVEMHSRRREAAEQGVPWNAQGGGSEGGGLAPEKFRPPDPASVKGAIRQMFREALGRDPDADEMAQFADEFMADFRDQFEAEQGIEGPEDIAESVWDDAPELMEGAEGEGEAQVNPAARFQEAFQQRFQGELDFIEAQGEAADANSMFGRIFGTMDSVV